MFDGTGNEVVRAHYLLEGLGESSVELEQVEDLLLGGMAHFVDEHRLGHHQTTGLYLPQPHLLYPIVLVDVDVALYFLNYRPLKGVPLDLLHRNVPHERVDHLAL